MEYFTGLDVSLRSCALCIVDSKGTTLFERELPCEIKDIAECLADFSHPIERIGFEAGTMSQHRLCCTNLVGDSCCESSVVADGHEQTDIAHLQDHELDCL